MKISAVACREGDARNRTQVLFKQLQINNMISQLFYAQTLCLMPTRLVVDVNKPCFEMEGRQLSVSSCQITVLLVYRSPSSTEIDDDIVLRVLRTATLHGECLVPHLQFIFQQINEEFLHEAATSPTHHRKGHFPSTPDLVFSKYSSSSAHSLS